MSNAESFHVVFKGTVGGLQILYQAEVDGVETSSRQLENLADLRLVEAKVRVQDGILKRVWAQSYLAGVEKVVIGWRDSQGSLKDIDVFATDQLRPEEANESLVFLAKVLRTIQEKMSGIDNENLIMYFRVTRDQIVSLRYRKMKSLAAQHL